MTIYLYIKTHNVTGLKYFGKTIRDPYKYKGSGKYWTKHIKKNGNNVTTKVVGAFLDSKEATAYALTFSKENNIVESNDWANLKEENGLDGSPAGVKFSDKHKENIRISRLGKCYNQFTDKTRQHMSRASKIKIQKQIQQGKHAFSGESGKLLAKRRNDKLVQEGKHNFQNNIFCVDLQGNRCIISSNEYWSQIGPKSNWQYIQHTSNIAKQRLNSAKGDI